MHAAAAKENSCNYSQTCINHNREAVGSWDREPKFDKWKRQNHCKKPFGMYKPANEE